MGTIRKGNQKDIPQIRQIWEACFTTDQEYLQMVFTFLFPHSTSYVYLENGKILSTLLLIPITLKSNTHPTLNGKYLYGVGTLPEARGKKLSIRIMETASKQMKEAGIDFIITRPAGESLFPFYREQGFTIDVPRGTFKQPVHFQIATQEYSQLINPVINEEKNAHTHPEPQIAADKLRQTADSLFNYLAQTYPHRFEWPVEILQYMIRIGEFTPFSTEAPPLQNQHMSISDTPTPENTSSHYNVKTEGSPIITPQNLSSEALSTHPNPLPSTPDTVINTLHSPSPTPTTTHTTSLPTPLPALFALVKPLSPTPPQWFQQAFFNFPME